MIALRLGRIRAEGHCDLQVVMCSCGHDFNAPSVSSWVGHEGKLMIDRAMSYGCLLEDVHDSLSIASANAECEANPSISSFSEL